MFHGEYALCMIFLFYMRLWENRQGLADSGQLSREPIGKGKYLKHSLCRQPLLGERHFRLWTGKATDLTGWHKTQFWISPPISFRGGANSTRKQPKIQTILRVRTGFHNRVCQENSMSVEIFSSLSPPQSLLDRPIDVSGAVQEQSLSGPNKRNPGGER